MRLGLPTDFRQILRPVNNVTIIQTPGNSINYMPIHVPAPPRDDMKLRKAHGAAIHQEAIVGSIQNGVSAPAFYVPISSLPKAQFGPAQNIRHDLGKAGAMFDAPGWMMGEDRIRTKDATPCSATLFIRNGTEFTPLAQGVQAQPTVIGIQAEITVLGSSAIRDQCKNNRHQLALRRYDGNNS